MFRVTFIVKIQIARISLSLIFSSFRTVKSPRSFRSLAMSWYVFRLSYGRFPSDFVSSFSACHTRFQAERWHHWARQPRRVVSRSRRSTRDHNNCSSIHSDPNVRVLATQSMHCAECRVAQDTCASARARSAPRACRARARTRHMHMRSLLAMHLISAHSLFSHTWRPLLAPNRSAQGASCAATSRPRGRRRMQSRTGDES